MAVSGGRDSMLLADLLHEAARERGCHLLLAHYAYGFRPDENTQELNLLRNWASARGLELRIRHADEEKVQWKGNLQAQARELRRSFLEQLAADQGVIFSAHHAGDQQENLLSGLLKGKAPWGLSLMEERKNAWLKPLLGVQVEQIHHEAESRALDWCEDSSNNKPSHAERNWIRHQLLAPLRHQHGNGSTELLDKIQKQCLELANALKRSSGELYDQLIVHGPAACCSLERKAVLPYHNLILEQLLRRLGRERECWSRDPGRLHLQRLLSFLRKAGKGARVPFGKNWELSAGRDQIWLAPVKPPEARFLLWPGQIRSLGGWSFQAGGEAREGAEEGPRMTKGPLLLRNWQAGDRIPSGLLADRMGDRGFAPARKRMQPVLSDFQGRILAAPGFWSASTEKDTCSNTHTVWMYHEPTN